MRPQTTPPEEQEDKASHVSFVPERGHEESDMSLRAIAAFAIGLALAIALVFAVVWGLLSLFSGGQLPPARQPAAPTAASPLATDQVPPEPRLQVAPPSEQATLEARQETLLNSYGLPQGTSEAARIPLDRAQELLLTRGLPTPAPTPSPTATGAATTEATAGDAAAGQQLFQELGCSECHLQDGSGQGPSLVGVFGSQVTLQDGQTVTADAAYVRRSILEPRAQIVAGYEPVMPSFSGELSEQQIEQLIAYVRSLAD